MNPLEKPLQAKLTRRQFLIASAVSAMSVGVQSVANRLQAAAAPFANFLPKANAQLQAGPQKWFLPFADNEGRPWGDGTAMAERARQGMKPWYDGCKVTTFVGGYETMSDIRETFRRAINEAEEMAHRSDNPILMGGNRGYVLISDWRINPLRDISSNNEKWTEAIIDEDPTVLGWILKLMQAGIRVRIIMWIPMVGGYLPIVANLAAHIEEHRWLTDIIQREDKRLLASVSPDELNSIEPFGIAALDLRVTNTGLLETASIHQKTIVIRVGSINIAYVGGVDLAYTRRDGPFPQGVFSAASQGFLAGDYQSGNQIEAADRVIWPREEGNKIIYNAIEPRSSERQDSDLPMNVYGDNNQIWHDQHLRLEGPIVNAIDDQFSERWRESARAYTLIKNTTLRVDQVIFSTERAFDPNGPQYPENRIIQRPLGNIEPARLAPDVGNSSVQMWRTIPLRSKRTQPPFIRGEFTIMAGISNAVLQAKELIWIYDQYFWSRSLGRLINKRLREPTSNLHVIIILPPYADSQQNDAHFARLLALTEVTRNLEPSQAKRVGIYALWHPLRKIGIYCHAKMQTYDGDLLVCGSANLNRRSFMCDAELDCAVFDPQIVKEHQQKLWAMLFGFSPYPNVNLSDSGSGATFFSEFQNAASSDNIPVPYLIPGPIFPDRQPISLPTDPPIYLPYKVAQGSKYLNVIDPSSLINKDIDRSLEEWVQLIESPQTRDEYRKINT
jgi:phosphatidylserine/phosphatidylglycerophosphate/cardiolipin synthase-like enzyme